MVWEGVLLFVFVVFFCSSDIYLEDTLLKSTHGTQSSLLKSVFFKTVQQPSDFRVLFHRTNVIIFYCIQ